jgi:hypothetical protein
MGVKLGLSPKCAVTYRNTAVFEIQNDMNGLNMMLKYLVYI